MEQRPTQEEQAASETDESFLPPSHTETQEPVKASVEGFGVEDEIADEDLAEAGFPAQEEEGEPLLTEAQFRAKFADELNPPDVEEDKGSPVEVVQVGTDRFLLFTLSGCYYNFRKEKIDFDDVKVKIPYCDEENGVGSMHVRRRFAAKAVKDEKNPDGTPKYPDRIERMCQVYIDDIEETTGALSFVGKDIKTLDIYEMQELAVSKDIRFIPLPSSDFSKRDRLIRTYVGYSDKILKKKVKWQEEGFSFMNLPSIILDGSGRFETHEKITNEEMIAQEQQAPKTSLGERDDPKSRFTIEELKTLADSKGVEYPSDVEFSDLYKHLFAA